MSVILEANQNNADHVYVNGNYTCSFPTGVPFYKGDRLTARLCSIDSQKSQSNTVVIPEDMTAVVTYSYYDCDYDPTINALKKNIDGTAWYATGTYKYYCCYESQGPLYNTYQIKLGSTDILIKAGRYDPLEISALLTRGLASPGGLLPSDDPDLATAYAPVNKCLLNIASKPTTGGTTVFSEITNTIPLFNEGAAYQFPAIFVDPVYHFPYYFYGAALMAFQFGINGSIFQWSFGHTPFENPAELLTRNAVVYTKGSPTESKMYLLQTASGITIHDLQPVDFWTNIGLYDETNQPIITPLLTDPTGMKYFTLPTWQCPKEGASLNFFTPSYTRMPTQPTSAQPTYYATDAIDTEALLGNELTSNTDGGYFLVNAVLNGSTSEYIDNTNIHDNIVAIVSTQYNSANTITGFADSAVVYTHTGAPYIISSVTINILDPLTKQTAPQLGANNTIIFQIDRAPQELSILDDKGKPETITIN